MAKYEVILGWEEMDFIMRSFQLLPKHDVYRIVEGKHNVKFEAWDNTAITAEDD